MKHFSFISSTWSLAVPENQSRQSNKTVFFTVFVTRNGNKTQMQSQAGVDYRFVQYLSNHFENTDTR